MPESDPLELFGDRVRTLRKAAGMTQEDLGAAAGIHFADVSKIERGVRDPGVRTVAKLAAGLGVPVAKLFEE